MKYLFVSIFSGVLLLYGLTVMGQSNIISYDFGMVKPRMMENPNSVENNFRPNRNLRSGDRALNILWDEDFSGNTALTTANGSWTVSGSEGAYWSLTTSASTPLGYPNYMIGRHLLWDSRTPVSAVEPSTAFATTQVEGSVMTPTIDLTGYTNAILEFNLNGRYCCHNEPWTVAVSNDNGTSWGGEISLNLGLNDNQSTSEIGQPLTFSVNISPYLDAVGANNNDVKLRFTWTGVDANGAGQISSYYSWEIDDIVIYESPQYEIIQDELWMQDLNLEYEYTSFPTSQVSTLTVQALISNNGLNVPTNLQMEISVIDALTNTVILGPISGGVLSNSPFNPMTIDTITFATNIDLSAYLVGEYIVKSTITYNEADGIPENDTLTRIFKITDGSMGHINYDVSSFEYSNGYTPIEYDPKRGAIFKLSNDATICGVDFYLESGPAFGGSSGNTELNVPCAVRIHQLDASVDMFVEIAYYGYELTTEKVGDWYTFNFLSADPNNSDSNQPIILYEGETYIISFESSGSFWYRASMTDADFSGSLYLESQDDWFWSGNEPWVLINLNNHCLSEIEEETISQGISVSQNVPNPFNQNSVITYSINETASVTIDIYNLAGKAITSIYEGSKDHGKHKVTINAEEFAEGVYFYCVMAGNYSVTKMMVVGN